MDSNPKSLAQRAPRGKAPIPSPPAGARPPQVFLVHGEDEWKVSSKARELIRRAIPAEEETLGLEVIHAQAEKAEEALAILKRCREAILTVGFLGGRKAVWLRSADFLDQTVIGKAKEVRARLRDLADTVQAGLPPGHILVVTAPDVDVKSDFYRACQAAGEVLGFQEEKPWQRDKSALPFAAGALRDRGVAASQAVLEAFVAKVGCDSRQLQQEAEKLALYVGAGRPAQLEDVGAVVSPARDAFAWELEDALGNRDLGQSLRLLRQLLFQKEEPIKLIGVMESRFRSLLILREALDNGWIRIAGEWVSNARMTPEEEQLMHLALNDNRLKNRFVISKRAIQAAAFTRAELERCRRLILRVRRQLVSSSLPAPLALELLIVNLCRTPARRGAPPPRARQTPAGAR